MITKSKKAGGASVPASRSPSPVSVTVRHKVFAVLAHHHCRLIGGVSDDLDFSLADLTAGVGMLAAQIAGNAVHKQGEQFNLKPVLEKIAAQVIGILDKQGVNDPFALIHAERERQERLFIVEKKFLFTCASPTAGPKRKLRVLVEEIGEVAQAIDHIEIKKPSVARATEDLRDELIQVAAVAVAWLESLEGK